jgi:hypothetical protein
MKQIDRRISFNGGEISPWTDPRVDLDKYRSSCRRLENFRPAIYGGAFSRPGMVYVAEQLDQDNAARLVPFEFSADTNLILEFTEDNLRVWTTGDTPALPQVDNDAVDSIWTTGTDYERGHWIRSVGAPTGIFYCLESHTSGTLSTDLAAGKWLATTDFRRATPYQADELNELQFAQLNDLVFITHPNHPPHVLSRFANNRWTIEPIEQEYPALRDENITAITFTASATTGSGTITASGDVFDPLHVGTRWVIKHRRSEPFVVQALSAAAGTSSAELFVLGDWSLTIVTGAGTGNWEVVALVERSFDKSTWETVRTQTASRADRSGIITGTEINPCWLRITTFSKDGSTPTNGKMTLEAVDPDHYGIFEVVTYNDPTEVTVDVVFELGGTGSTKYWSEPAWSDYRGWPRSVCIHETRLIFGGNEAQPQTLWASIIDDFYNFRIGSDDDLGLSLTLSQKANAIQWMVSQDALLVGTAGSEGPVGSREGDKAITPGNVKAGKFTQTGSSFIQAVPVQDAIIFVNRSGHKLWEMAFDFASDGFKANDMTLLAEHIADGGVRQISLQKNPDPILWAVDASGVLLGLAYERNQNIAGWFRYVTDGTVESVAVIGGSGEEDQVWVTVNRTNGRFIERLQPDRMRLLKDGDAEHVCCADSAVIHDGAAATTITGLDPLEGEEVCILADGAPVENQTVTGGEVTLDTAASVVIVGLPFTCYLQPTFLETNDPNTISKVAWKCIHRVTMEFWKSVGCHVSANDGESWERVEFRAQGQLMDTAIPLFTGVKDQLVDSRSARQVAPIIRQNQPLPLNIQSLHTWHELNAL